MGEPRQHHLVPEPLLRRFADGSGRVMMERRDRSRRRTASVPEAAAATGFYTMGANDRRASTLAGLLNQIDDRGARAIDRILAGAFPPSGRDRAHLALFIAFHLLLGGAQRAAFAEAVALLAELVASNIPEDFQEVEVPSTARPTPGSGRGNLVVHEDDEPSRLSLAATPYLARQLATRTWQLVRFPSPRLVTGDTPVVPWSPSGSTPPSPARLSAAAEVRVPLDPRHALILARATQLGEVIRDLGDRHANALNRTVADAARRWMYYHPDSDPLGGRELDPA